MKAPSSCEFSQSSFDKTPAASSMGSPCPWHFDFSTPAPLPLGEFSEGTASHAEEEHWRRSVYHHDMSKNEISFRQGDP